MTRLLLLIGLCSLPAFGAACTMQTINGSDTISSGPAKINSNFTCLNNNTPKIFSGASVPATVTGSRFGDFYLRTGTNTTYQCFSVSPPCTTVAAGNWVLIAGTGGGSIPNTTNALRGNGAGAATPVTGSASDCVHVDGTSAACPGGGGTGDVVGPISASDNAITRYDGTTGKLIQNSAATIDDSGNVTANSFQGGDTSNSGGALFNGLTSGAVMLAAADTAGTAIVYVLPSTNGVSGQFLKDNGVVACPTLAAGSPAVCHQLTWATGSGGSGCVPSGSSGQILVDDGAGACGSATPTISGSTITASLTGHASLDVPTTTTLTGGAGIGAIGDLSTNRTIATASGEADFLASGALTCGAATQGKMQVHTTPLQYCDNAATPALQYAAYGDSAGAASAVAVGSVTGLGTGVGTALATNVSGSGAICLASGSACSGGAGGGLVLLEQHTASASATLDFTTCISSTYDRYFVTISQLVNATNAQALLFRVSTNGGSTYDAGTNYGTALYRWSSSGAAPAGGGATTSVDMTVGDTQSSTANNGGYDGALYISNPGGGAASTKFTSTSLSYVNSAGPETIGGNVTGRYVPTTAVNAFRFLYGSGNITSGTIRCYGIAKS